MPDTVGKEQSTYHVNYLDFGLFKRMPFRICENRQRQIAALRNEPSRTTGGICPDSPSQLSVFGGEFPKPLRHGKIIRSVLRAVTFDVEDGRAVEKIQPLDEEPILLPSGESHER